MLFPSVGGCKIRNSELIKLLFPSVGDYMLKNTKDILYVKKHQRYKIIYLWCFFNI